MADTSDIEMYISAKDVEDAKNQVVYDSYETASDVAEKYDEKVFSVRVRVIYDTLEQASD